MLPLQLGTRAGSGDGWQAGTGGETGIRKASREGRQRQEGGRGLQVRNRVVGKEAGDWGERGSGRD